MARWNVYSKQRNAGTRWGNCEWWRHSNVQRVVSPLRCEGICCSLYANGLTVSLCCVCVCVLLTVGRPSWNNADYTHLGCKRSSTVWRIWGPLSRGERGRSVNPWSFSTIHAGGRSVAGCGRLTLAGWSLVRWTLHRPFHRRPHASMYRAKRKETWARGANWRTRRMLRLVVGCRQSAHESCESQLESVAMCLRSSRTAALPYQPVSRCCQYYDEKRNPATRVPSCQVTTWRMLVAPTSPIRLEILLTSTCFCIRRGCILCF